ncbi:MAG: sulfatase [Candidatus Omnitrophica bacterium]|nr:sulfatase [Candidatus Omnitrophota bacterium]
MLQKKRRFFCATRSVIAAGIFFWAACIVPEAGAAPKKPYNVILVVIDSLRPDHLGCYGYSRPTSAAIDALAQEGVLFLDVTSQATWTLPSFASLLTSRYVFEHKVINDRLSLPEGELTIAEILKIFGYETGAFTSNVHMNRRFNFYQGFNHYEDVPFIKTVWPQPEAHISEFFPRVVEWVDAHRNEKFFLLLHINDAHAPLHAQKGDQDENMFDRDYHGVVDKMVLDLPLRKELWGYSFCANEEGCTVLRQKDIEHIRAHYDASVFTVDGYIGRLAAALKERGLWEETILIVTADHGVDLLDHGTLFNNSCVDPYQESVRIPLIIVHPGLKAGGRRIDGPAQSVDIVPTILDCLGLPPKKDARGLSLRPYLEGKGRIPERFVYAASSNPRNSESLWQCIFAVRWGSRKLIARFVRFDYPVFVLFDLSADPAERHNLFPEESGVRDKLVAEFRRCYLGFGDKRGGR